jgi:acyl-CoA reductase-like NAD-dependent aldehyde dehydrogenase
MSGRILQLNFKYSVSGDAYKQAVAPLAHDIGAVPGLRWKIWIKARNALILSFSRATTVVGQMLGETIQDVLKRYGASPDLVQWVKQHPSRQKANLPMRHKDVSLILATGGPGLVKAAYSSGTPAIGVGPGNAPVLICADADIQDAAEKVMV